MGSDSVTLTWMQVLNAAITGCCRQIEALKQGTRDRGGATRENGWSRHIEGAAGELALAKYLDLFPGATVNAGKAADVGPYEVRTRSSHMFELKVYKSDADDRVFILITGMVPTFRVRGWMWGREAKRLEWWKDPGSKGQPAYFPPNGELHKMEDLPK